MSTTPDQKQPENVLRGPFMQIPLKAEDYEDMKRHAEKTNAAMARAIEAVSKKAAAELEEQFSVAVDNALGKGTWTMKDLEGRVVRHTENGSDIETITLDGEPVFAYGPLETEFVRKPDGDLRLNARRLMRVLNGPESQQEPS